MSSSDDPRSEAVRRILLENWDPHNASQNPAAHHTYDAYIPAILELIGSNADEEVLVDYLHQREAESMCFPSLGTRRLLPVARRLLALR